MSLTPATETALGETRRYRYRFVILLLVILIAGISQGLLLPLLAILLERSGVSPDLNGLHSAAMYVGIFATMFIVERPVYRYGYKPVITVGIVLITAAVFLFPVHDSFAFWMALRLAVGAGDSALHFATLVWIVNTSPAHRRGRNISLYGMSYGLGFSLGPLGVNLLSIGDAAPFLLSGVLFTAVLALMLRVPNEMPTRPDKSETAKNRFTLSYRLAWFALIPSLLYGFLEATLNSSFPLYALRIDLTQGWISLLLLVFGIGSLILQLPLGIWSDKIGRKPILVACGLIGSLLFFLVPVAGNQVLWLLAIFILAGGVIGSFYSLGLAYAADVLPRTIVPAANVIASIHFSIGSILGPSLGGFGITYISPGSLFLFLGTAFLAFTLSAFFFRPKP